LQGWAKFAASIAVHLVVNTLIPSSGLKTPNFRPVVDPNEDTLYSLAVFDLSQNDIVMDVPEVDSGRYWSFGFYDP
jgi:hypothetical protein